MIVFKSMLNDLKQVRIETAILIFNFTQSNFTIIKPIRITFLTNL